MKKAVIAIVGVILVTMIGVSVYYIVSMSKTIESLTVQMQQTPVLTLEPTPGPTPDHEKELIELESLYAQKEALLRSYKNSSKSIKTMYGKNEKFGYLYSRVMESFEMAKYLSDNARRYADEYNYDYKTVVSASRCAMYDTYIQKFEQGLIEAKGAIEILKIEFNDKEYSRIETALNAIKDL